MHLKYQNAIKLMIALVFFKSLLGVFLSLSFINIVILCVLLISIASGWMNSANKGSGKLLFCTILIALAAKILFEQLNDAGIPFEYSLISASPKIVIILMCLAMLHSSRKNHLDIQSQLKKIAIFSFLFALVELFLPSSVMNWVLAEIRSTKMIINEDLTAYKDNFLGWERARLGSIFFEPITFGMVSAILFCETMFGKDRIRGKHSTYVIILSCAVFLSGAKSALLFILIAFIFKTFSYGVSFLISIVILGLLIYVVSPFAAINALELTVGVESMANHVIGLVLGIKNSLDAPFLGHGLGTAGYQIYLLSKETGAYDPFANEYGIFRPLENGNESAVGVFFYENGFLFGLLFLVFTIYKTYKWHSNGHRNAAAFCISYFYFALLSESAVSLTIVFVLICAVLNNLQKDNDVSVKAS
jgi:hypothetical protein